MLKLEYDCMECETVMTFVLTPQLEGAGAF